jgi:uncharacterized membrane protein
VARIEKSIEVKAPVEKAFALLADLEGYPRFMASINEVKMTGEKTSHWKLNIGGRDLETDGETIEITPHSRIAWKSIGEFQSEGSWNLQPTADRTKVTHVMDYNLPGVLGAIIDRVRVSKTVESNIELSLQALKALLEQA